MSDQIEIRGYSLVFHLERRLHRIDRWRIPLPYGLPLLAVAYATLTLTAILAASTLPLVGDVVAVVPAPLRLVIAPIGAGLALSRVRPDGRPAHRHALAWTQHRIRARRVTAGRPANPPGLHRLGPVPVLGGVQGAAGRRGRVHGPATVEVGSRARVRARARVLHLTLDPRHRLRRARRITVPDGCRLELRAR